MLANGSARGRRRGALTGEVAAAGATAVEMGLSERLPAVPDALLASCERSSSRSTLTGRDVASTRARVDFALALAVPAG